MFRSILAVVFMMTLSSCTSYPPIKTEEYVDLERFMGDWYVIANIPTFIEKGAHNAIESYRLDDDGTIDTTFTFHQDNFDGEVKTYNPRGFIVDKQSNAVWGMRFIWPFKAEYRIVYVDKDYQHTIIGRSMRDYVWIMARTPKVSDADYKALIRIIKQQGYDTRKIEKIPQQWKTSRITGVKP